jgi:hypothetical protein
MLMIRNVTKPSPSKIIFLFSLTMIIGLLIQINQLTEQNHKLQVIVQSGQSNTITPKPASDWTDSLYFKSLSMALGLFSTAAGGI